MDSRDGQRATGPRIPGPFDALAPLAQRGIAGAANLFVQSVDLNDIVGHVDLNAVLDRVDIDRLLARVDVNAVLARVDIDALLSRVDLDAVLARVDVDALVERVDLSDLLARSSAEVASETMHETLGEAKRLEDSADHWAGHLFHHKHAPEAEPPPAVTPPEINVPANEDPTQP